MFGRLVSNVAVNKRNASGEPCNLLRQCFRQLPFDQEFRIGRGRRMRPRRFVEDIDFPARKDLPQMIERTSVAKSNLEDHAVDGLQKRRGFVYEGTLGRDPLDKRIKARHAISMGND